MSYGGLISGVAREALENALGRAIANDEAISLGALAQGITTSPKAMADLAVANNTAKTDKEFAAITAGIVVGVIAGTLAPGIV